MARTRINGRLLPHPERRPGVSTARQVQGKQLSYNNINDTDAAFECVAEFDPAISAACVIVKHANPCGVADRRHLVGGLCARAGLRPRLGLRRHHRLQPQAGRATAREIVKILTEVIIAPDADEEAIASSPPRRTCACC
jgi:phosphoribosylaminoimidazolecarboxamide formyltransferase/IMP cyclohydrolase